MRCYCYCSQAGEVLIYKWLSETWTLIGTISSSENNFGSNVKLDFIGQTVMISDSSYNVNKGLVKVYTYKQDNQWEQIGQDLIGDNDNDLLGDKIDMNKNGNIIAVSKKVIVYYKEE